MGVLLNMSPVQRFALLKSQLFAQCRQLLENGPRVSIAIACRTAEVVHGFDERRVSDVLNFPECHGEGKPADKFEQLTKFLQRFGGGRSGSEEFGAGLQAFANHELQTRRVERDITGSGLLQIALDGG